MSGTTDDVGPIEIAEDILALVKPDLHPGERLLWASRSGPRCNGREPGSKRAKAIWSVGLVLLTVGCAVVFRATIPAKLDALGTVAAFTGFIAAVAAFFVAVNLFIALVRSLALPGLTTQVYALTDRRAMIWLPVSGSKAVKVHTFPRGTIKGEDLHRVQYPDGSGDLFFRNEYHDPAGYRDVAEVRRVEDLVRRFLIDS